MAKYKPYNYAQSMMMPAAVALTKDNFSVAQQGFGEASRVFVSKRYTRVLYGEDCGQVGLGAALLGMGNLEEAQKVITDLLWQAVNSRRQDRLLYALVGIALLTAEEGEAQRAVELYALAGKYPFVGESRWFADAFGHRIQAASACLPPATIEAARECGRYRDLWDTAEELTLKFNSSKG